MPGWEWGPGGREQGGDSAVQATADIWLRPQATIGIEPREVGWLEEEEVGKLNRGLEGNAKATPTENSSENEKL
eukprot:637703-Rhodomonas_salina.2